MRAPARLFLACFLGVACSDGGPTQPPEEGSVLLQFATYGGDPDVDGYFLTIDGEVGLAVAPNAQSAIRVAVGRHTLQLTEVAPNCEVLDGDTHQVEVLAGDAFGHRFEVRCDATGIHLQVSSSGVDLDASGYHATVGGIAHGTVPANGALSVTRLDPGTHTITLTGVAPNCQFVGDSTRTIEVTNREVSPANFTMACLATSGTVRVNVTTSGVDVDDRFEVAVVGSTLKANVVNGTGQLPLVPGGTRTIRLQEVAGNCSVDGGAEQDVVVPMGGATRETVEVTFAVRCANDSGTIRITTSTTGTTLDTEYEVVAYRIVCGVPGGYYCDYVEVGRSPIAANGSVSIESRTGDHYVYLQGVAANCTVTGSTYPNGELTVQLLVETTQAYTIECASPTVLQVGAPTTGTNQDAVYRVYLWEYYYYGYYPWATDVGELAANDILELIVEPGEYWVELREIDANCAATVTNPTIHFVLAQGETRLVEIPVACQ